MNLYAQHAINPDLLENQLSKFTTTAQPLRDILPEEATRNSVLDAVALINAVLPAADYLTEAADLVLDGKDPSDAMKRHAVNFHIQALVEAVRGRAKSRQAEAINDAADAIIQSLRSEIFDPAITRLSELAEKHGRGWDMNAAIAAQDFERAAAIKEGTALIVKLGQADKLRRVLHPGAFDGPAAYAKEPNTFELATITDHGGLGWWMQLIHAGANLHFPTLAEYHALHNSKAHTEHREAQAAAEEAENLWEPISLSYVSRNQSQL